MRVEEEKQIIIAIKFFEQQEPVGVAQIETFDDEIWLAHFAIREDFRGKGYGQKALQLCIEKYGVNTLTCAVGNKVAQHIYQKYGFNIADKCYSFDEGVVYIMKRIKERKNG